MKLNELGFSTPELLDRLLTVLESEILPLTRQEVARGNKIFGAAILHKADLSTVIVGSNNETANPLWHGEVHTIKLKYEDPTARAVAPEACLFLSTHEPCTMCLSAIAWGGYDNFFYLFSHEDSRDAFAIPHDLRILQELFGLPPGGYARENAFFSGYSIRELVESCPEPARSAFRARVAAIVAAYDTLSETYQAGKADNDIPLN
jgi:tRNA(Arg) A34 adenosine deaminase TadA